MKDPYGLYAWYRDSFYPGYLGDSSFDWSRPLGLLTYSQIRYNQIRECRGLRFMRISGSASTFCGHPLCPSCWHRRNVELLKALHSLKPAVTYIRSTWFQHWDHALHPAVIKRFKARSTRYRLVGYTLNYTACDTMITDDIRTGDPFRGELTYQLIGVFQADAPVRDKNYRGGSVHVEADGDVVGLIDRKEIQAVSAPDEWLAKLTHPWLYKRHPTFSDYLRKFRPTGIGRDWTRINTQRIKEQ